MNKRNIYIVIFIISVFGLAIVQYKYLEVGLVLAKVQFSKNIALAGDEIRKGMFPRNQLTYLIGSSLEKDNSYFTISLDSLEDASSHFLNDFITEKLVRNGIDADFSYELYTRDSSYYLRSPRVFQKNDQLNNYPIELTGYLPALLDKRISLNLKFRDLNRYFLMKLNGLTLPSLLFIIGIITALIWGLRTYYWQRNLISTTNEFINNLTHELKTPVFSIGLASKILNENSTAEQRPVINIIRQQVARLSNHIDKVLELGNLESGKAVFNLVRVDFRPTLLELCEEFKILVSMEEVAFTYDLKAGEYTIMAEVFHLENAINNLLDNAKKYAKEPKIALKAASEAGNLIIEIQDNGPGIDKRDSKRIFQKYFRVQNGDLHDVKGYGLGLSYVMEIIKKLKGNIRIDSELGKGTKVILSLPLCKTDKNE